MIAVVSYTDVKHEERKKIYTKYLKYLSYIKNNLLYFLLILGSYCICIRIKFSVIEISI